MEMLDARDFISGCSVILRQLGFDYDLGIVFARNNEIWRLIKTRHAFGALGFSVADAGSAQHILDYGFKAVPYEFANGISMTGKWATQEAFIKKHRVWCADIGEDSNALGTSLSVSLVQPMKFVRVCRGHSLIEQVTGSFNKSL